MYDIKAPKAGAFLLQKKECDYMGFYEGGQYYRYPWETAPETEYDNKGQPLPGQGVLIPTTTETPDYSNPGLTNPGANTNAPIVTGAGTSTGLDADLKARYDSLKQSRLSERTSALQKIRDDALSGLGTSRNTAMTGYDSEAAALKPQYYNQRNQMGAQSDVGAKNFAEFMASRGIRGAAGGMPEIYRNAALQGNIGASKMQQSAAENDIGRRRSNTESEFATRQADVNRSYEQDLSQAQADIESDITQQYLAEMQRADQQRIADLAAQGMTSIGQPTAQTVQNTAGAYSDNYQTRINDLQNDNDPSNDYQIPYLQAARQQKIKDQEESQAALEAAAAKAEAAGQKEQYDRAMEMWKARGEADESIASILGVPVGAKTASYDISRMNALTAQTNANKQKEPTVSNSEKVASIKADLNKMPAADAYNELLNNSADYILDIGSTLYNALLADYKTFAGIR